MSGPRARKAIILFTNWDTITGKPAILTAQDVTFENIDTNGDVGSGAAQLAQGNHNHDADYEPKNSNIQEHISDQNNPHSIAKTDVNLGNVDNTSDADKPVSTAQQTALDLKADKNNAALTGNPTAPTQLSGDDSTKLATTAFVQVALDALIGAAPSTLDTLAEIASAINDDENLYTTLTTLIGQKLTKAGNLSDLADAATARTNLGLGAVALLSAIAISDVTGLQTALNGKEDSFAKNTAFNKNFGTATGTVTEGNDSRLSDNRTPTDDSVDTSKLDARYKSIVAMSALNVDWSSGQVFTKTLTGNSTLTFSNLHIGVKDLEITGDYTLGLPTGFKVISGEYDGSVLNFIQIICTNTTTPSGWVVISQEPA